MVYLHCFVCRVLQKRISLLNFGSYNYLGFSENKGPCKEAASEVTHKYGMISYGSRQELGIVLFSIHTFYINVYCFVQFECRYKGKKYVTT